MIAIIAEKPSVGQEIARVVGATEKKDGYITGNGYMVTWTYGNMLSLAMPKDSGTAHVEWKDFPPPKTFRCFPNRSVLWNDRYVRTGAW